MKHIRYLMAILLAFAICMGTVISPFADSVLRVASAETAATTNVNPLPDFSKYIKTLTKVNNILKKTSATKDYAAVIGKIISYANTGNSILGIISNLCEKLFGGGNGSTETPITLVTLYEGILSIQASLNEVNRKLDYITEQILKMQISDEEKTRTGNAKDELRNVKNFNDNDCKPLDIYIEKYQTELARAFRNWYINPDQRGDNGEIWLLHAMIPNEDGAKTESLLITDEKDPTSVTVTETGISVDPALTFRVPAEAFKDLPAYSVDHCASDFRDAVFRWATSINVPYETAKRYAQEAYETLIYRLGCSVVQNADIWRASFDGVKTAFRSYLNAAVSEHTGLDAQLQLMYNVYAFESEARDNIVTASDQLIARTSMYGMFVLDLLQKSKLTSSQEMETLADAWADTMDKLTQMGDDAITGHDDYCYLTGTRLFGVSAQLYSQNIMMFLKSSEKLSDTLKVVPVSDLGITRGPEGLFRMHINGPDGLYIDQRAEPDSKYLNNMATTVTTVMLYHMAQQNGSSLIDYMTRCGANSGGYFKSDDIRPIMTQYIGTEELATKKDTPFTLTAHTLRGSHFTTGTPYQLSSISDSRWKNFSFRHKVMGATVDLRTGAIDTNAILAAAFDYNTNEENLIHEWNPKNVTNFETAGTIVAKGRTDYKGTFNSYYYTDFDDSFIRDLYMLYLEPLPDGGDRKKAATVKGPLASYLESAKTWMQKVPKADMEFTHTPVDQSKYKIVNSMGKTRSDRMSEYAALVREAAVKAGMPEPSEAEIAVLQKQLEDCWQSVWKMTNENANLKKNIPISLGELEMKDLVRDVINREYLADVNDEIREVSVENVNLKLMNAEDMNIYLRISPRSAVEHKNGAYRVFSCFDITPVLVAHSYVIENGNVRKTKDFEQTIYIGDQLRHDLSFRVRIPVSENSSGTVTVRHFDNWYTFEQDATYKARVQGGKGKRYVDLVGTITGPLSVKGDYVSTNPNPSPRTGDDTDLLLYTAALLIALAGVLFALRKRNPLLRKMK